MRGPTRHDEKTVIESRSKSDFEMAISHLSLIGRRQTSLEFTLTTGDRALPPVACCFSRQDNMIG